MNYAASLILDVIDIGFSLGSHLLFYAKTSRLITGDDSIGSWLPIWIFDSNVFLNLHIQSLFEEVDYFCVTKGVCFLG